MEQFDLFVSADGEAIEFVHDDELIAFEGEGEARTMRASHVEPAHSVCPHCDQMVGHASDCEYEKFGKVLAKGWTADMRPVGGPILWNKDWQPFKTRAEALAAERAWLATEMETRQVSNSNDNQRER